MKSSDFGTVALSQTYGEWQDEQVSNAAGRLGTGDGEPPTPTDGSAQ